MGVSNSIKGAPRSVTTAHVRHMARDSRPVGVTWRLFQHLASDILQRLRRMHAKLLLAGENLRALRLAQRHNLGIENENNENKVGIYCGRLGSSRDEKTAQYLVGIPFASRKYWPGGSVCTMSRNSFAS